MGPLFVSAVMAGGLGVVGCLLEGSLRALPVAQRQARLRRPEDSLLALQILNSVLLSLGAVSAGATLAVQIPAEPRTLLLCAVLLAVLIWMAVVVLPRVLGMVLSPTIGPVAIVVAGWLTPLLSPLLAANRWLKGRVSNEAAKPVATVTEQGIIDMATLGVEEGTLIAEEAAWIRNALRLNDKTAHDLMTPRTVVYRLPAELPLSMVSAHSDHWQHSRLPLCRDNDPDRVVGMVYRREVFDALLTKDEDEIERTTLASLSHEAEFIPDSMHGHDVLQRFLRGRTHLFIVVNEHGGMEGVITLEDVLEDLLGQEIVDQHDQHVDMQEYARKLAEKRLAK
jgi:CBS domain containing-hemolysin-like protein